MFDVADWDDDDADDFQTKGEKKLRTALPVRIICSQWRLQIFLLIFIVKVPFAERADFSVFAYYLHRCLLFIALPELNSFVSSLPASVIPIQMHSQNG